jgi:hypothetical protein
LDEQRFDQLSRRLGASRTRRQALRAIAGAVVAGIAGVTAADAQSCTAHHKRCQGDGQCCPGAVCEYGRCMPGCRIDGVFQGVWMSPPGDICQVCTPELSTTAWSPANEGVPCWSGDPNAGTTTCQSGTCAPVAVVTPAKCPPLTACHLEGEVDPATGMCVYPFAPEGTPCGIGEMCHGGFYQPADACDGNGFCIGGGSKTVSCAPYSCAGTACADSCETDSDCLNGTSCCDNQCLYPNTIDHCGSCGNSCPDIDACTPASCENGVCNQSSACAPVDSCTPASCDNGACNQTSVCTPVDSCTPASCDNGACNQTSACTPVDACTPACDDGVCKTVSDCATGSFCHPVTALCEFCTCNDAVVSSSATDPTQGVLVDDDLVVYKGGTIVYIDANALATRAVIPVGSIEAGDQLRFFAFDPEYGDSQELDPLYLHCRDGEGRFLQTLDSEGYFGQSGPNVPVIPFYEETFTVTCAG